MAKKCLTCKSKLIDDIESDTEDVIPLWYKKWVIIHYYLTADVAEDQGVGLRDGTYAASRSARAFQSIHLPNIVLLSRQW